jgi:hypothetical protein
MPGWKLGIAGGPFGKFAACNEPALSAMSIRRKRQAKSSAGAGGLTSGHSNHSTRGLPTCHNTAIEAGED